jgi:hypothetical protein
MLLAPFGRARFELAVMFITSRTEQRCQSRFWRSSRRKQRKYERLFEP